MTHGYGMQGEAAESASIESMGTRMEREDIEFTAADGVVIRGWLYLPPGQSPAPAISMAHGFAAVKEHGLDRFARRFAESGFVVLVHDHRNFGASDGEIRGDIDPWQQIMDWRRALTFLERHPRVDPERLGIWGTSYAGGHVLVLGATDRRVQCVVAQVPTISGYPQGLRRVAPDATGALERRFIEDDRRAADGNAPTTMLVASTDPTADAVYRTQEAAEFYLSQAETGWWANEVTLRSTRASRMYEPGIWARRVSPTPLLFIVATHDTVTLTDLELDAHAASLPPKELTLIRGGHFAPYDQEFAPASRAAVDWFVEHLQPQDPTT